MKESTRDLGLGGENIAEKYLLQNGFKILDRNFSCQKGEVDLIGTKKKVLHFIEVKTRRSQAYGLGYEAVSLTKQRRLSMAAQYYLMSHSELDDYEKIFSVLSIDHSDSNLKIEFFENAFDLIGGL